MTKEPEIWVRYGDLKIGDQFMIGSVIYEKIGKNAMGYELKTHDNSWQGFGLHSQTKVLLASNDLIVE